VQNMKIRKDRNRKKRMTTKKKVIRIFEGKKCNLGKIVKKKS